jgi:hypothetical protein
MNPSVIIHFAKSVMNSATSYVMSFVNNPEYPLDQRWEIFIDSGFGRHEPSTAYFDSLNEDAFIPCEAPFYKEPLETISVQEILDAILKDESILAESHSVEDFQKECLSRFINSFTLDN